MKPEIFFVTCPSGFEQTLCDELTEIYEAYNVPAEVDSGSAGCYVTGPFDCCILANLYSFCASRVLYIALECEVFSEQEIYDAVRTISWPSLFDVNKTFAVKGNVSNSFLQNSMYLSLKVKDALCDTFMEKLNVRPNVEVKKPDVKVYVRLVRNKLSVSLDTSGDPLFMRGYKKNSNEAPLKETLAASLLRMTGWNKLSKSILTSSEAVYFDRVHLDSEVESQNDVRKIPKQVLLSPFLMDQFCGSGTIVVEAALALIHFNPNCLRPHFSFMNLFPETQESILILFEQLKAKVLSQKKDIQEIKSAIIAYANQNKINQFPNGAEQFFPLVANDMSQAAVTLAKEVAQNAGVSDLIYFSCLDAANIKPHASCGLILINPPYGERMGANSNLPLLYKTIGDTWKLNFPNWTAWLLSSSEPLTKSIGLRSTRKFSVYNGNLECRFLQYVMYAKG